MKHMSFQWRSAGRYSWLIGRIALCIAAVLCWYIYSSSQAFAQGVPGGDIANPVVRAVDIAKPAVVRIITSLGGRVTVHFSDNKTVTFPRSGNSYKLAYSGSGAFISAHGDILTADHVVNPPRDASLDSDLYQEAAGDVADYINQTYQPNPPYTSSDAYSLLTSQYFPTDTNYDQAKSMVYLSTDYTGALSEADLHKVPASVSFPVEKIEKESSTDMSDVAIVHIALDDTPSIPLGDSSDVEQQDELTIIGFPGNADISDKQVATQMLTSSVNKIYVSSIKQTDNKDTVIQVGGNVEHGDSGGPALNKNGQIVGVVSFYVSGASTPVGTSFLQTSDNAKDLLGSLDLQPGTFETSWSKAFADYASTRPNHWHLAQNEMQKLATNYPNFHALLPFLSYTQDRARTEVVSNSQSSNSLSGLILPLLGILALLLLVGLLLIVLLRRGQQQRPYAPAQSIPQYGYTMPPANTFSPPVQQQPNVLPRQTYGPTPYTASTSPQPPQQVEPFRPAWEQPTQRPANASAYTVPTYNAPAYGEQSPIAPAETVLEQPLVPPETPRPALENEQTQLVSPPPEVEPASDVQEEQIEARSEEKGSQESASPIWPQGMPVYTPFKAVPPREEEDTHPHPIIRQATGSIEQLGFDGSTVEKPQ